MTSVYTPAKPISTRMDELSKLGSVSITLFIPGGYTDVTIGNGAGFDWPWLETFVSSFFSPTEMAETTYKSIIDKDGCDNLIFSTLGQDISPVPSEPAGTDMVEPASNFLSALTYNQSLDYAATKGLTYPLKSSVFRGLTESSEAIEGAAPAATVILASGDALWSASSAAYNGDCH